MVIYIFFRLYLVVLSINIVNSRDSSVPFLRTFIEIISYITVIYFKIFYYLRFYIVTLIVLIVSYIVIFIKYLICISYIVSYTYFFIRLSFSKKRYHSPEILFIEICIINYLSICNLRIYPVLNLYPLLGSEILLRELIKLLPMFLENYRYTYLDFGVEHVQDLNYSINLNITIWDFFCLIKQPSFCDEETL